MSGPRRIPGFIRIARNIIQAEPGLTAQEIVSRALENSETTGISLSAATNPEASLTATLHKVHGDYGLERRHGGDGRYRYYPMAQGITADPRVSGFSSGPVSSNDPEFVEETFVDDLTSPSRVEYVGDSQNLGTTTGEKHPDNDKCCIELSGLQTSQVKALVDLRLYPSEHDAHTGLVKKGLEAVLAELPNLA